MTAVNGKMFGVGRIEAGLDKTGQKMADFQWTSKTEKAALLVAEDELKDEEIAQQCGVVRATLNNWKKSPEFNARVDEHIAAFRDTIRRFGIGRLENRVRRLNRDWKNLQQVIQDRAQDALATADINEALISESQTLGADTDQLTRLRKSLPTVAPGMETGLVVRDYKAVGLKTVEVFSVDTATLAELRATEQQAAKELGQWTEKHEHGFDPNKPPVVKILKGVSIEQLK